MLCVAALIVGCSPDPDEPTRLPPAETSSPSPVALALPSEAAAETPQGAAAFARYYFDLVDEGFRTGDAAGVRRVSHPECDGCNNLIAAIEQEPAAGERIEGGEFSILFAEAAPLQGEDAIVDFRYAVSELRVLDSDGTVLRSTPAEPEIDGQLRLVRSADGWIVRGFRNVTT